MLVEAAKEEGSDGCRVHSERLLQVREHVPERGGVAGEGARRRRVEDERAVDDEPVVVYDAAPVVARPSLGEAGRVLALRVVHVAREVGRGRGQRALRGAGVRVQARHGVVRVRVPVRRPGAVEAEHLRGRRRRLLVEPVVGQLDLHRRPSSVVLARPRVPGSRRRRRLDVGHVGVRRVVPLDHALLVVDSAEHPVIQLQRSRGEKSQRRDRSSKKKQFKSNQS